MEIDEKDVGPVMERTPIWFLAATAEAADRMEVEEAVAVAAETSPEPRNTLHRSALWLHTCPTCRR